MNIFYLDENPEIAAIYHCDKHVIKMSLEYIQILSTTHHLLSNPHNYYLDLIYKKTHMNHPSVIWARNSFSNYDWLTRLTKHTLIEYTNRYGKHHKSEFVFNLLNTNVSSIIDSFPNNKFSPPPLCMPNKYFKESAVEAYRDYYKGEKSSFAKWKNETPSWWE